MKRRLFAPSTRLRSPQHGRIYARYEIAHTAVDFAAAAFFVVGSAFFFYESLSEAARWCFLLGSILFAAKPTIRLARELAYPFTDDPAGDEAGRGT